MLNARRTDAMATMGGQYQHYVQSAYLDRWKVGKYLYLIDKEAGTVQPKQAAKSIMGMENMQTAAMEQAFAEVEACIGHTDHAGEIVDAGFVRLLAEWMALHLVRNGLNAPTLGTTDYAAMVRRLAGDLAGHHGYWMDFTGDVFITGDNPVVQIRDTKESFFLAALSPRRCVFLVWEDKVPPFLPPTINWYIYKAASRYCVSFDEHLHIEDPPSATMPCDDRE